MIQKVHPHKRYNDHCIARESASHREAEKLLQDHPIQLVSEGQEHQGDGGLDEEGISRGLLLIIKYRR